MMNHAVAKAKVGADGGGTFDILYCTEPGRFEEKD